MPHLSKCQLSVNRHCRKIIPVPMSVTAFVTCSSSMPENPVEFTVRPENPVMSALPDMRFAQGTKSLPLMLSLSKGRLRTSSVGSTRRFPYRQRSTHQLVTRFIMEPARSGSDPDTTSTSTSCGITRYPRLRSDGGNLSKSSPLRTRAPFFSRWVCRMVVCGGVSLA